MYTSSPDFSTYVDVHLVLTPFQMSEGSRQFNAWRNLARLYARTGFVMMLDVDFIPCTDFRSFIKHNLKAHLLGLGADVVETRMLVERFAQGNVAFVIPAFEYAKQEDGADPETFPHDKTVSYYFVFVAGNHFLTTIQELLSLVHAEPPQVTPFHAAWARGHQSTNYTNYYHTPPGSGQVYRVVGYDNAYEPYTIFSNKAVW